MIKKSYYPSTNQERQYGEKMPTLTMELPDKVFAALRVGPDDFTREMRLAAAAAWYEQEKVSQEVAARIAGLNRTDFLLALARMGKDSFQIDFEDLDRELSRG
jgi:predicted HTH domain antitoxin